MARRAARLIALTVFALVAALGACELAVRAFFPQDLTGTWLIPSSTGPYLVNKSEGSARHQLGARIVRYSFIEPHLRGPRVEGTRRVLVLGDSFTFGLLLSDPDTVVSRLQQDADAGFGRGAFAFLNAGTGGSGTAEHLAYYEDFGARTGADTVLVLVNRLDITRSQASRVFHFDAAANRLSRREVQPAFSIKALVNALPMYDALLERSQLLQLARRAVLLRAAASPAAASAATPGRPDPRMLGAALFRRFAAATRSRGHRLIVVTTGWPRFPGTEATDEFVAEAPALFDELGVPFADLASRVEVLASGLGSSGISIPKDLHPNERGAQIIAQAVWEILEPRLR